MRKNNQDLKFGYSEGDTFEVAITLKEQIFNKLSNKKKMLALSLLLSWVSNELYKINNK